MASLVNGKPAMKRIGYFGEEGYNGIGDMYRTNNADPGDRYKGAQFQTNPLFKTRFNLTNGLFGKPIAIYSGEPYMTLEQFQRREKNKLKKLQVSETPFRPGNPPKHGDGFYGTCGYQDKRSPAFPIGGRIPYMEQGDRKGKQKGDVVNAPFNVTTNPVRKGTFGYVGTTIGVPSTAGERRAWKGVAGEYAYVPDPYDAARIAEKEYKKKLPPFVSETPFRPANPPKRGGAGMWGGAKAISGHPKDCGGTISPYHQYIPTGFDKKKTKAEVEAERYKDKYERAAFRPSNPARKGGPGYWGCGTKGGGSGTLSNFPQSMADPYDTLRFKLLEEKRQMKDKLAKSVGERVPFNPGSFGRSKRTPSIFVMNIRI